VISQNLQHLKELSGPVLVTGHTGFKGIWLTMLLERLGVEVVGYSLAPIEESLYRKLNREKAIHETYSDLRDFSTLARFIQDTDPSLIFHLAAQPLVLDSYKFPRETFEVNVMGTVNLLEVCKKQKNLKAVLVATTDKVYLNKNEQRKFKESDELLGKDPYSASKVAVENTLIAFANLKDRSFTGGLVALRSGNVIGGGDVSKNRLIPDLVQAFSESVPAIVRNPSSTRPWQHVLDPLFGYVLTAESTLIGNDLSAINFGPDSDSLSVKTVSEIALETWGDGATLRVEDSIDHLEAKNLELDSSFAHKTLGWRPRWSQEKAVIDSILWWKDVLRNNLTYKQAVDRDLDFLFTSVERSNEDE
jgi:CDP-glucose 4,6-dehydratase